MSSSYAPFYGTLPTISGEIRVISPNITFANPRTPLFVPSSLGGLGATGPAGPSGSAGPTGPTGPSGGGGGSLVQAGYIDLSGSSTKVTLATPYPDTKYSVVVTPSNPAPTFFWSASVFDNANFTIECSSEGVDFNWITCYHTQ